jgi:Flp pilus assembly pilin Flp
MKELNKKGQSLTEYLVLVALISIGTLGIVRVLSQTISAKLASITLALQGKKKAIKVEEVKPAHYKKKDLKDFINGVSRE